MEGVITVRETLEMIARQRGRDFEPGAVFEYSNTGYFLLAQIVERVTRGSLAGYLHANVFEPLEMERTQVLDDPQRLVAGRATGYAPGGDGWRISMNGWEQTGDGAVMSTVVDMAKWDANFYEPKVGAAGVIDTLQTRGRLDDGTSLDYAAGLLHGNYRGQPTVWHAGGVAGYRSQFERYPELDTSIILLCNAASAQPDEMARRIADIVLESNLSGKPSVGGPLAPEPARPEVELTEAQLDAWAGHYRETTTGEIIRIERTAEGLEFVAWQERNPLVPTSAKTFRFGPLPYVLEFDGARPKRTLTARGIAMFEPDAFEEIELHEPSADELAALTGRYRSEEIGTEWRLSLEDGALVVSGPVFPEPVGLTTAGEDGSQGEPVGQVTSSTISPMLGGMPIC